MMNDTTERRRYHSPRRAAQAAATRQRLLDAARRLFVARGYAATTLPAIARAAGVATPTLTAAFGTKAALLDALIATTTRGDEAPAPLRERDWWLAMLAEPDATRLLGRYAAAVRGIHERTTDIFEIVRGAATAHPDMAALRRELAEGRLRDSRTVAEALDRRGALRRGVSVEHAADQLWALGSAELYRLLAAERGWPPERYQAWLAESLTGALLGSGTKPRG